MTDDDWLRGAHDDDRPPPDVVPSKGLTLETLRWLNETANQEVTLTEPGEVLCDPDGMPVGVAPSTTTVATLAGAVFRRAELDALGGHPDDYPNLRFIEEGETP